MVTDKDQGQVRAKISSEWQRQKRNEGELKWSRGNKSGEGARMGRELE